MDKLQLAHEYALEMAKQGIPLKSCLELGWKYADAMQAEAEKRKKEEAEQKRKEIREILKDASTFIEREGQHFDDVNECEVDWSIAPSWAKYHQYGLNGYIWVCENLEKIEDAPSFGLTGTHVVERPHGF